MTTMFEFRKRVPAKPTRAPVEQSAVDLEALSRETGVPVEVLRTLASISDPTNEQLFTAETARKAFAGVRICHTHA